MELKSRSFTTKKPHVGREPQVADSLATITVIFSKVFSVVIIFISNNFMLEKIVILKQ